REWELFREEVELEADRLENGESVQSEMDVTAAPAAGADPQEQIDQIRAQVARLARRLEEQA
ncbi:MAG: hypothetical protein ACO3B8_09870, partial [Vulcanococcus sp.]